jgi:hypothetical protein
MNEVKLKQAELLDALTKNREKHIADFDEAMTGYEKQRMERAQALVDFIKNSAALVAPADVSELAKQVERKTAAITSLPKPQSYVEHYDQEIAMVTMSTESVIELSAGEFAQYVMDKWAWKKGFEATTSSYTGR